MAGRVFSGERFVNGADVGAEGGTHLHRIAEWLQDVAFADGLDAGMGTESAWIIRRTSLRIGTLPRLGETLTLRTWCGGLAASVAERRTSIEGDGGAAVDAEAIWVHVDPIARRPARFPPDFLAAYAESAGDGRPRTKLRHPPAPPANAEWVGWEFRRSDIDVAAHVNNAAYWRIAEEFLPAAAGSLIEAEYRSGVGAGLAEVALDREAGLAWVMNAEGEVAGTLHSGPASPG